MDFIISLVNAFNAYAKANPVVAGVASLWGVGILTWMLRKVPSTIFNFIADQTTTRLTITNDPMGMNLETYSGFIEWLEKSKWMRWSRSVAVSGNYNSHMSDAGIAIGIGDGTHLFVHDGRFYWARRTTIQASTQNVRYSVTITQLGRNRQAILDLIDLFKYRRDQTTTDIWTFGGSEWSRLKAFAKRPLDTVITANGLKETLVERIKQFKKSKDWYNQHGLIYKLTTILYGVSGTGKTSLIKAIASEFDMSIAILNLSEMTDRMLQIALAKAPKNSIILLEDFDSSPAVRIRGGLSKPSKESQRDRDQVPVSDGPSLDVSIEMGASLSLSGVLNAFDGVVTLDDRIIFLTTNVLEDIDPAFLRAGRIDHIEEVMRLPHHEVVDYIRLMFPHAKIDVSVQYEEIAGCDLQKLYFENRTDAQAFVQSIPTAKLNQKRDVA